MVLKGLSPIYENKLYKEKGFLFIKYELLEVNIYKFKGKNVSNSTEHIFGTFRRNVMHGEGGGSHHGWFRS